MVGLAKRFAIDRFIFPVFYVTRTGRLRQAFHSFGGVGFDDVALVSP